MRWLGYVVVSVLRAKQASACFARSWGKYHFIRRQLCPVSSVPSSAHASCLGKCFGSAKGRRDDAHNAVLVWAIMQPLLEVVIEVGIRASGGVASINDGALYG